MPSTVLQSEKKPVNPVSVSQTASGSYETAFDAWQKQPGNVFACHLPEHNGNEIVFLEGVGIQEKDPAILERRAIENISNRFGILFLFQLLLPHLMILIAIFLFSFTDTTVSYSLHDNMLYGSDIAVFTTILLKKIFRFLIPIVIARKWIHMPKQVLFCHQKVPVLNLLKTLSATAVVFVVMNCWILCFPQYDANTIILGSDYRSIAYMEPPYQLAYFILILLFRPILETILYNGSILHVLRQFGDRAAILITAVLSACMAENLLMALSSFGVSCITGIAILKSGDFRSGLVIRLFYYLISFCTFHSAFFTDCMTMERRNSILVSLMFICLLIYLLPRKKPQIQQLKPKKTTLPTWRCCVIFLVQVNLLTFSTMVSVIISVTTLIL